MKFSEMKYVKLIVTTLMVLMTSVSFAQTYNNEWIDFSKTYYKFKVINNSVHRITPATLATVGLNAVDVREFQLFRNGKEVAIYTSVASGPLPVNGYLEFAGEKNDGKADKELYRSPAYQHTDKNSLETDTAIYFLTRNTGANLRLVDRVNDIAGNVLPVEPYFMHTYGHYFGEAINPGIAAVVGEYVYSSSYDKGEFFSSREIRTDTPGYDASYKIQAANLFVNTAGGGSKFKFGAFGNALNTRQVSVKLNGTDIAGNNAGMMDYFNDLVKEVNIATSLLSSSTANLEFHNLSNVKSDRIVISFFEITYPRNFNFGGENNFSFDLPARAGGYYLVIDNFNYGSTAPVLYDNTYGERYVGDISTPGKVRFAIPANAQPRKLRLVSEEPSNITTVNSLTTKTFVNFANTANQGDFLIISNPILYAGTSGNNPVLDYKNYRNSINGGSYNTSIAESQELVDQFAFGIRSHPSSVKNYIRYARNKFASPIKYVLLIGKGLTYLDQRYIYGNPNSDLQNLVPTFGWPGSDNLLASPDVINPIAAVPIGRLSVIKALELENYLEKLKEYESVQRTSPNTIDGKLWMKNTLEVTGASDQYLGIQLCSYMDAYRQIVVDTLTGFNVSVFCKNSTNPFEQVSSEKITKLFEEGLSMVTYFGHSSSTTLEFNIDNPENYNNPGKYPVFSVNGCKAGDFFTYDVARFQNSVTLSEKFTLAKQRGSIAFVASTHYGIVNYLNIYINALYQNIATDYYGSSLGEICRESLQKMVTQTGTSDFYARLHAEEITLHGDPAIKMNQQPQPDYIIEEPQVKISPSFISISQTSFTIDVTMFNMGKAIDDSITVEVKREFPDGSVVVLERIRMKGTKYSDVLNLTVPIVGSRDKGANKLIVTLDADNEVAEVSEMNNIITREFFIYEDEISPVFPYEFGIVNDRSQKLYASTANPFRASREYVMEIDTTALFNSGLKKQMSINSVGGLIEFNPQVNFIDSTVYYWRTAFKPSAGGDFIWNPSSFLFKSNSSEGFNQSHVYQHTASDVVDISLDSVRATWDFGIKTNSLYARNAVFPTAGNQADDFIVSHNGNSDDIKSVCGVGGIIVNVFDKQSFQPWFNAAWGSPGQYGSDVVCGNTRIKNFQFYIMDTVKRRKMMEFLDFIPDGDYVVIRNVAGDQISDNTYAEDWKADTTRLGAGNSIYHRLKDQGFALIDSISRPRSFIFIYQKNRKNTFEPRYTISDGVYDKIVLSRDCPTKDTLGYITSPSFGPAKKWKQLHWDGKSVEPVSSDNVSINIIGITSTGLVDSALAVIDGSTHDLDISFIDAAQYPFLKLRMRNCDSVNVSPYQLKYWRLDYDPVPEGALTPALFFTAKDTLEVGETLNFGIAFKNISHVPFDSLKVRFIITDKDNTPHEILLSRMKPLQVGDTILLKYPIDTRDFIGLNTIYVDFNPNDDQPEQHHFNNFGYLSFYVKDDHTNPLLDVTFDGVHILNRDIVSAKPHIQIKLKDEAKYLLLNDTSLITTLQVKFPDQNQTMRTYKFGTDTLRFIPAQSGADNTAVVDFTPHFPALKDQSGEPINPEGDQYELFVWAKDRSGNKASELTYHVSFRIIDKPMISNLLNYPNPFTTSTAFVFTITGSEVPDNIKIQILTVTGKIVREITKDELGPLHIGRNITEYKWDGNDQYGQRLGNGVYLYRVVTTLKGKRMDKFTDSGDNTDKYFNKGYGKMYLMR